MSVQSSAGFWRANSVGGGVLVGTLIAIYMVSQFLRNSVAVIAPDLAMEFGLSGADLGLLASAFFFVFAAVQIPLGVALDRFGPRLCLIVFAAITVGGALVFAAATSPAGLIAARGLLGLGSAASLMAPLAIYARRFSPDRFATLTGLQYGLGTAGTLFATAPFAWAVAAIGWRGSFVVVAGLTLAITVLLALVVKDDATDRGPERHEGLGETLAGIVAVLRTPSVGRLFLMQLTGYSSFALIVGLWGGPYLSHIYGYGLKERGDMLLVPALALIVGAFLWGPMDRVFRSYKTPVLLGSGSTLAALLLLGVFGSLPPALLIVWMIAFGLVSANLPVLIAHGKSLFPPHLVGRGLTLLNVGSMGGVFLTQAISGLVIDRFPQQNGAYPVTAYQAVFLLQAAFILLALFGYFGARDPRREKSMA